jgi:hypothetical protein
VLPALGTVHGDLFDDLYSSNQSYSVIMAI